MNKQVNHHQLSVLDKLSSLINAGGGVAHFGELEKIDYSMSNDITKNYVDRIITNFVKDGTIKRVKPNTYVLGEILRDVEVKDDGDYIIIKIPKVRDESMS